MTIEPQETLMLTRPPGQDTVIVHIDAQVADLQETALSRVFLSEWRAKARAVPEIGPVVNVTHDAMLLEMPTMEPDDDGRVVPVVVWCRPHLEPSDLMRQIESFTQGAGRVLDVVASEAALKAALAAVHRVPKQGRGCLTSLPRLWPSRKPG